MFQRYTSKCPKPPAEASRPALKNLHTSDEKFTTVISSLDPVPSLINLVSQFHSRIKCFFSAPDVHGFNICLQPRERLLEDVVNPSSSAENVLVALRRTSVVPRRFVGFYLSSSCRRKNTQPVSLREEITFKWSRDSLLRHLFLQQVL